MSFWSLASWIFYSSVDAFDAGFGLPKKLAASLHFRRSWKSYLRSSSSTQKKLWIHGASVGELEDLANFFLHEENLKSIGYDFSSLIITASSISAKEKLDFWAKTFPISYVGPIPPERISEIKSFLKILNPEQMIMSHSDIWPCLISQSAPYLEKGIVWLPARSSSYSKISSDFFAKYVKVLGARSEQDLNFWNEQFSEYSFSKVLIGNTRLDRIFERIERAQSQDEHALEKHGCRPENTRISIILGSAWPEDAEIWAQALELLSPQEKERFYLVVLPHESKDIAQIARIQRFLPSSKVLGVQGILLEAYKGFDYAYVGGGFKTGLHNVLEPSAWGIPTWVGPDLKKQPEASLLREMGSLKVISNPTELGVLLRQTLDPQQDLTFKRQSLTQVQELLKWSGASKRLVESLKKLG